MDKSSSVSERIRKVFQDTYNAKPEIIVRAPGRVNLIGEHTDYNDGFVLPMAINRAIYFAARPRADRQVRLHFSDFNTTEIFNPETLEKGPSAPVEYIKGVASQFEFEKIEIPGLDGVFAGDIPISAGLSSSAALELAAARVFCALADIPWEPVRMAKLAQRAENEWVGMNCGIMDQLISAIGEKDKALLIDCRSLQTTQTTLPGNVTVFVMDTGTRRSGHGLVDSAYSERRAQCEEAARVLKVPALRDCSLDYLEANRDLLDPLVYRRARHVVTENQRTLEAQRVLAAGDPAAMGKLMNESHASLQYDFEVSTPALDTMADLARSFPGCYGARMTGGGFGGCAVAIVQSEDAAEFQQQVALEYENQLQIKPQLYACRASEGVSLIPS
ncbi:MAG: galactokinase [Anaerolineales bacterium]|nr:galactokinase [Anaerolineales bacterium]